MRRLVDERHEAEIEHAGSTLGAIARSFPAKGMPMAGQQTGCVPYRAPAAGFHAIKLDAELANIPLLLTHNAAQKICAAMDLFVVPTISFRLLYGILILRHDRRRLLWLGATTHPTAEWIARQLTEACGWDAAPRYLIRDRDRSYGEVFVRRIRAMGIRDRPTSPQSP